MLNNAAVRAARPRPAAYKLADGQGLYLYVAPTGSKSFRMRFRDPDGKEQTLTIGLWPAVTLDQARARREAARAQLARGEDPRTPHSSELRTFGAAALAWHAHRLSGWSPVHAGDVLASLERDVLPAIGDVPLDMLTRPAVLGLLERVEARGAIATARRLRQRIGAVVDFARAKGWTSMDNPADVGEALANTPAVGRQQALVDVDELRALLAAVDQLAAAPPLKLASRFLALTAVRLAALRGARWDEIEDLDGPEPLWRVPAARMKLGAAKKGDPAYDHLVPLSPAAVAVLREARTSDVNPTSGNAACERSMRLPAYEGAGLIFAGRAGGAPIGAGALGELYARAGFAGRHVPHGWRASFSTVMNENHPADRGAIDRALGHAAKGMTNVEAAYNRAQHLDRRQWLFERWAGLLGA